MRKSSVVSRRSGRGVGTVCEEVVCEEGCHAAGAARTLELQCLDEDREQRGHEEECGDVVRAAQLEQVQWILVPARLRHHQRAADE